MIVWATIIVEELHGHWSAWFEDNPGTGYGGEWPTQAIDRLLDASGHELYDTNRMYPIIEGVGVRHLEFVICYQSDGRFPEPSSN